MGGTERKDMVTTTERSLEILDVIQDIDGATLSAIAAKTELATSTVHKHLATLSKHGYVKKEGEHYSLGLKFYNKGNHVADTQPYFEIAERIVEELAAELGEDTEFIVENDGRGMVIAASYHKRSEYSEKQHLGSYFPLHATAAGKAILAGLPDEKVKRKLSRQGMEACTDNTITTTNELFGELNKIRDRGYAQTDEEFAEGLRAVAKRVDSPYGSPLGAISVLAPIYRMESESFTEQIPQILAEKVTEFEEELGQRPL